MENQEMCVTPGRDASTASVRSSRLGLLKRNSKGMPSELIRFDVELEDSNRIYFAGEELTGHVNVNLSDDLPMQGIILRIVGEAYVNVSSEPRPWTAAKRLANLRRPFKSKKIILRGTHLPIFFLILGSPSTISDQSSFQNGSFFRGSDHTPNWETATTTTVTAPRSQRSTLQRQPTPKLRKAKKQKEEVKFRAHEKYFEHKMYVFGHRYSSTRELMWKGNHSFGFSYTLPSKLPASFHGRFGYVRYFCEASLERHNQPTIQRRAFFSVSTVMDLHNDPKADSGVSKEKKTNSWCFCCPSGTVIVSAKIRKRGFVPGEMIPIQAYVFNVSNKPVQKITARIIQIATYFSSKGFQKKTDETILCEKVEGTLPPGESTTWDEVGPCVPPCPPSSTMIDCKLVTIDYRLEFVLDIQKAKEPLMLRMPLRIGTIPLEKVFKNLMDSMTALDFGDARTYFPPSIQGKYPKLPAVFSCKCIKGDRHVNRYYFRQIPRSMQSMLGISSRQPQQPVITDEDEVYAPKYITYITWPDKVGAMIEMGDKTGYSFRQVQPKIQHNGTAPVISESNHLLITVTPPPHRQAIADETPLFSDNSSMNGPSALCSPASFRSFKGGHASAPTVELVHRLASMGAWEHMERENTIRRRNKPSATNTPIIVETPAEDEEEKKNK